MLRKSICAAIIALTAGPACAFNLGNINTDDIQHVFSIGQKMVDANREIGEGEEISIGEGISANILGAWPLVNDPALQNYVNRVGYWIALQSDRPGLPWRFGVINSDKVNAFSCPGGTVLITRGLMARLRNESELAGVLGHEITHVTRKHQLKAIQQQMGNEWRQELLQTAAEKSRDPHSDALLKAYSAGTELLTRPLDKADEYEADRGGVVLAARSGYNPFGLVGVLQTLDAMNARDSAVALLFKTHPAPAARLDQLGTAMGDRLDAYQQQTTDTPRFAPIKKRLGNKS